MAAYLVYKDTGIGTTMHERRIKKFCQAKKLTCVAMVAFVMRCGWCLKSCRNAIPRNTEATAETTSHRDACIHELHYAPT